MGPTTRFPSFHLTKTLSQEGPEAALACCFLALQKAQIDLPWRLIATIGAERSSLNESEYNSV